MVLKFLRKSIFPILLIFPNTLPASSLSNEIWHQMQNDRTGEWSPSLFEILQSTVIPAFAYYLSTLTLPQGPVLELGAMNFEVLTKPLTSLCEHQNRRCIITDIGDRLAPLLRNIAPKAEFQILNAGDLSTKFAEESLAAVFFADGPDWLTPKEMQGLFKGIRKTLRKGGKFVSIKTMLPVPAFAADILNNLISKNFLFPINEGQGFVVVPKLSKAAWDGIEKIFSAAHISDLKAKRLGALCDTLTQNFEETSIVNSNRLFQILHDSNIAYEMFIPTQAYIRTLTLEAEKSGLTVSHRFISFTTQVTEEKYVSSQNWTPIDTPDFNNFAEPYSIKFLVTEVTKSSDDCVDLE